MQEANKSILTVEMQKKITMTGVDSVDGFSETEIRLTVGGKRVRISGSKLKVTAFSQGSGNFTATGEVARVQYGAARGKFFQRLFR